MDLTAAMQAPCPPEQLFGWVADLGRYPEWLTIVTRAEPAAAHAVDGDDGPAWSIELRGRLGPFARSKRLRMVRTSLEPARLAAFDRRETDGRRHAPWTLRAEVVPNPSADEGSGLTMRLHYGGALWGPVLERLLSDEIETGRERLLALVSSPRR